MNTPCPGSGRPPHPDFHLRNVYGYVSPRGTCQYCRREHALKVGPSGGPWKLRHHNGLPKPADGGCPYRCPGPECDFACYHPKDGAK